MFYVYNLRDEAKEFLARALSRVYTPSNRDNTAKEFNEIVEKIK